MHLAACMSCDAILFYDELSCSVATGSLQWRLNVSIVLRRKNCEAIKA